MPTRPPNCRTVQINMKKFLPLILVLVIIIVFLCALCGCSDELLLYVPDGAPALSVANVINDGKVAGQKVKTVVTTGEDVVAKCASGEADLAVLPTNAALKICSEKDNYQIFSVNVYGVLYVVGTEQIESLADLQGQTLLSIGLGNTPEYVFKTICDKQGVIYADANGINIKYEADASTIIPQILQGKAKFALIGEPAVTQLISKAASQNKTVHNLFDLQKLWKDATDSDEVGYPQASMIVKKALLTDGFAEKLFQTLKNNYQFVTENASNLNALMQAAGSSLNIDYTVQILERCNLKLVAAADAKADVEKYLGAFAAMKKFLPIKDGVIYETGK